MGLSLIVISAGLFMLQVRIFHRPRDTFFYLLQDLAFLPIQVLLVTIFLEQLLILRGKQDRLRKLNMVINVFFTELGSELLKVFLGFGAIPKRLGKELLISDGWTDKNFASAADIFSFHDLRVDAGARRLEGLRQLLLSKKDFLFTMLENPIILEHEAFTDLLLAVSHVADELFHRQDLSALPEGDYAHLDGDIKRAYRLLVIEWLSYMRHLKEDYPYLFSLAVRTNPFDAHASAIVK